MTTLTDKYPSRVESRGKILPRRDPVVYEGEFDGPLTADQINQYERDGFLSLSSVFTPAEVDAASRELERLGQSEKVRQSELAVTEPTSGEIRSVFAVQTVSVLFAQLAGDQRVLRIVEQLLGSRVYLHQSRINFKPGFAGKEFYWHSDFETWHTEDGMPNMRAISCSIALTDNTEFNGPLMLIPGSHKYFVQCIGRTPENHYQASLKRQEFGVPDNESLRWLVDQSEIVAPKGPAGSVTLFECNLMHGSNSNISPYPRSNAFFVYNSVENPLVDPFAANLPRPWYLGSRDIDPLTETDFAAYIQNKAAAGNGRH